MEHFLTLDLGDLIVSAILVVLYFKFKKELEQTDENALDDYEEFSEKLKHTQTKLENDYSDLNDRLATQINTTPKGVLNKNKDYVLETPEGIELTTFQIEAKEQKTEK